MPRNFFGGTYMVPDPPDFNWESLERASGLTFTEPQRDRLIGAMDRYLRHLTLQRVMVPTKDVKQLCERIAKQARALRQLLSVHLKNAPSDEYQINLHQATFSLFPYNINDEIYRHALMELEFGAKRALKTLREQGQPGRQDKEGLDVTIRAWHAVYRDAGGIGFGCTRSGYARKAQGPFLDLMDTALQQVIDTTPDTPLAADKPPSRDALAQRILSALKRPQTPQVRDGK
jgi:hypothetical protein